MTTVENILSYDGSELDIGLNYVALVISLVPLIICFHKPHLDESNGWKKWVWIPIFVILCAFQV